ncbi:MAG: HypC/HybG/HupF family hydrogenase formation chaperone [Leptothrix sp. (in: Bacteria)]|nr:HypC/HybG/HupF family hydrogenase formation chaperone [Leptothrix sp. (in: b-proteobacteria)]
MCIGTPMQVVAVEAHHAWCEADGQRERLDMALVGPQAIGTWVLGFHGSARQVMGEEEAAHCRAGRRALAAVLSGSGDVDACFADLVGRTPQLPAHLLPAAAPPSPP